MFVIKKKLKSYNVMHYEGIPGMATNMPCTFDIKDDIFTIHLTQGTDVFLPIDKIIKFESMSENSFLQKYHNSNGHNLKNTQGVAYLVITYISKENEEKIIVLWANTMKEVLFFADLQYKYKTLNKNIEL